MLPDIASDAQSLAFQYAYPIRWVGMENIALPLFLKQRLYACQANAYVSLDDPQCKGIHMSRLYTRLLKLSNLHDVTLHDLKQLLQDFLSSHQEISSRARIDLTTALHLKRDALRSELSGWRRYPLQLSSEWSNNQLKTTLSLEITYSSTCPCSAALARDLIQQNFQAAINQKQLNPQDASALHDWLGSSQGIVATPHSQRSFARLQFQLLGDQDLSIDAMIDHAEHALATPVQSAVKRIDEQAFALANGQNLMFCEDAVRRLYAAFVDYPQLEAFDFKVIHEESLHAHNAVAQAYWQRVAT